MNEVLTDEDSEFPPRGELDRETLEYLRSLASDYLLETRRLEKLAVGAIGAVYAWLATNAKTVAPFEAVWFVPFVISVVASLRCWAVWMHVLDIRGFLAERGDEWEGNLTRSARPGIAASAKLFWLVLDGSTFVISSMVTRVFDRFPDLLWLVIPSGIFIAGAVLGTEIRAIPVRR